MAGLLQKVARTRELIKGNGGIIGCLKSLYYIDDIKQGKLVGEDEFGNKYYENNYYFFSSNRWVVYNPKLNMEYDASQIPPEWHRWMTYMTDENPTSHPPKKLKWMATHRSNLSGTEKKYVPYSTTKPKIESWKPPQ